MKQSKMRILCLLLTAVMLLSLTACGKDKKEENSNVMKFDDWSTRARASWTISTGTMRLL